MNEIERAWDAWIVLNHALLFCGTAGDTKWRNDETPKGFNQMPKLPTRQHKNSSITIF
jgi:hypothetical protein